MRNPDESEQGKTPVAQPVSWIAYPPPEDEISLIDIWRVLSRRRWWIAVTFALFLAGGIAYALLVPPSYEYTTVIDVGTRMDSGGNTQPLTSPDALTALATNAIIPTTLHDYATRNPSSDPYRIEAAHPKDSNLVTISAKGPTSRRDAFKTLEQQVAQNLLAAPVRRAEALHQQTRIQAETAQTRVNSLQNALGQLRASVTSQPQNNTLHIQRSQTEIDLAAAQADLAQHQAQLAAFSPPEISAVSVQSQQPVGMGGKLVVVLAAIIGLLAGTAMALVVDFAERANAS